MLGIFGIGQTELLIVLGLGCVLALPIVVAIIVVVIVFAMKKP